MDRRAGFLIAGLLLCVGVLSPPVRSGVDSSASPSSLEGSLVGKKVPSLPVFTEAGAAVDLLSPTRLNSENQQPQKRWLVVYFWSAQCPCVRNCQTLSLFPLYRKYQKRRDIAFYAIASNDSDLLVRALTDGSKRTFLRLPGGAGQSPPYPIVIDIRHRAAQALAARSTPQCFLISPENRVVFCGNPDDSEEVRRRTGESGVMTRNYLGEALEQALAGKAVRQNASPALGCDVDRGPA